MGQGALALRDGDLDLACRRFGNAVALTPTWAMARYELGRCLRLVGDPDGDAEEHLRIAADGLPDRGVVRLEMAKLLEDQGRPKEARKWYREALVLSPADVRADAGAARIFPPKAADKALPALRRVQRRLPGELAWWSRLAEAAEGAGLLDEAEEALRRLLEASADRGRAAARLALFGRRTGREKAVQAAAKALSR